MTMKKQYVRCLRIVLCMVVVFIGQADAQAETGELAAYLPTETDVPGWEILEEPEVYAGEDLFLYINGGAEIYYEYGFNRVITAEYVNAANKSILIDIYEMEDAESAYGIYTLTKDPDAQPADIDSEGTFDDAYLLFRKGKFFVTITGLDTGDDVNEGILAFAGSIEQRITAAGQLPTLPQLLVHENLRPSNVVYIQGFLGLMNSYAFHADDIFGVQEGAIGQFGEYSVFLLKYADEEESRKWYTNALNILKEDSLYENFAGDGQSFSATDSFQQLIYCQPAGQYIVVVVGAEHAEAAQSIVNTLQTNF